MWSSTLRKWLCILATSGLLLQSTPCIPQRNQINGLINSSLINGVELALTLAIQNTLQPILQPGTTSTTNTTTTTGT